MKKVLEVCVDSLESARNAVAGGADRLELCSALCIGGLTPYKALLEQIRREFDIPIRCLMRPRAGDFLYTAEEIHMMARQIRELKAAGADGFVIGCLDPEGYPDEEAMESLAEAARGCGLTLHRAIDVSRDMEQTYLVAASLGIDTVLTSGGRASCVSGVDMLRRLLELRDKVNGPEVLIGAGVNAGVIRLLRQELPNARAFHMSGKENVPSGMVFRREGVPMGIAGFDEWHIPRTSREAVRQAREALDE